MSLEAVEGGVESAVREGGKAFRAHVDAYRTALWYRLLDLSLGLNGNEPLAAGLAHGNVPDLTQHFAAIAIAQPAKLRQKDSAVGLVELDLFRVGVAEAVGLALFLEAREVGTFGEEVAVGALQVLERLLQRVNRRLSQPCHFRAMTPLGEQLA
jgi:hypothetical protein